MKNYEAYELNVWHIGWGTWRRPSLWWGNIKNFFRCIKRSYQRITRGFCDSDLWELDEHYKVLFALTLRRLADINHGAPDKYFDEENNSTVPWQNILYDIADKFEKSIEPWTCSGDLEEEQRLEQEREASYQEGLKMLGEIHKGLWD